MAKNEPFTLDKWSLELLISMIGKFLLEHKKDQFGFNLEIEMPQLGSAGAGKFQLELITTS